MKAPAYGRIQWRRWESNPREVPPNTRRSACAFPLAIWLATVALWLGLSGAAFAHVDGCHSRKCDRRISAKRHRLFWPKRFHAQPQAWQDWAHRVSWCESNDRRIARESGFWSYFQWTLPTWHTVGGSGNPETHSYAEQALRAIRLARQQGTGAWPVCGR